MHNLMPTLRYGTLAMQVVMKTCGTTTLLRCVATLLQAALEQQGLVLEWMGYSRKNFTFPGDQLFPHSSFDQELQYLRAHSHLSQRLNGAGLCVCSSP